MPIYEYQCSQCGHQLEALQAFSEAPLTLCPKCNSASLHKLMSNTSFQLKGSGWYKTDYEKKTKPAETNAEASKPAETSSDTTSDNKKTETTSTNKSSDSSDSKAV